jgi:hypothetical protein
VMAELNAEVSKLNADAHEDGADQKDAYAKADIIADVEKANADLRHDVAYAKADADRMKPHDKPRMAYQPNQTIE